jgi:hypothetical protein
VAGEQFAKFVKVADIPMDREKLAMYLNVINTNINQIYRTYTSDFVYLYESYNDAWNHEATYYISTDNTLIANGKNDRPYRINNQYFRQSNSIVEDYNEFGFFDNPVTYSFPEFRSVYIDYTNANRVADMYLTNEINYVKQEVWTLPQDIYTFWKSSRPNFVDEFPIVTIDNYPYIFLKNGEIIQQYNIVGYYQGYFITYHDPYKAVFIRLSDMHSFILEVWDDIYMYESIDADSFYIFIYNNELYCVVFHGFDSYYNFPNYYSKVYKITITGTTGNIFNAIYTLIDSYTTQSPMLWANKSQSVFSLIPRLVGTNLYKHIDFEDMLKNPVKINKVFCNALLNNTYILEYIFPTLSTYQDKYIVFKYIGALTQSSTNIYIRDNIIFDKNLDPNGRPVFYIGEDYGLAYDVVTNQVIISPEMDFFRANYADILNGIYNLSYIGFITDARELVGAHNGWLYYIEGYGAPRKLKRLNYTTLVSEDIITGLSDYQSVKYIQIGSILYIWFPVSYQNFRIYKIDMMSPSNNWYVGINANIYKVFFDIPANNIFYLTYDGELFILTEIDWVNHTRTSKVIFENIMNLESIVYINDLGLYKRLHDDEVFEYEGGITGQYLPYIDTSHYLDKSPLTKIHITSTKYRSTYSIYKLVYANDLSLDEPKTLETTIS